MIFPVMSIKVFFMSVIRLLKSLVIKAKDKKSAKLYKFTFTTYEEDYPIFVITNSFESAKAMFKEIHPELNWYKVKEEVISFEV